MTFYVYEHLDPDTLAAFYVGKGRGDRARRVSSGRNEYHQRKVASLQRRGRKPLVLILQAGMTEHGAFEFEIERISYHRATGAELCNFAPGGEGASGYVLSEETCAKMRASWKTRGPVSEETRAKLSAAKTGRPRPAFSAATREKIRVASKGREVSTETRAKIGAANKGRSHTPEAKAKISLARRKHK